MICVIWVTGAGKPTTGTRTGACQSMVTKFSKKSCEECGAPGGQECEMIGHNSCPNHDSRIVFERPGIKIEAATRDACTSCKCGPYQSCVAGCINENNRKYSVEHYGPLTMNDVEAHIVRPGMHVFWTTLNGIVMTGTIRRFASMTIPEHSQSDMHLHAVIKGTHSRPYECVIPIERLFLNMDQAVMHHMDMELAMEIESYKRIHQAGAAMERLFVKLSPQFQKIWKSKFTNGRF